MYSKTHGMKTEGKIHELKIVLFCDIPFNDLCTFLISLCMRASKWFSQYYRSLQK